jgi:uncharacterized protein (TIGR02598 family)
MGFPFLKSAPFFAGFGSRLHRGFTLVEVILALAVMAIGLVGILGIFPVALNTARESKQETRIAQLAQTMFSDLRTRDVLEVEKDEFTAKALTTISTKTLYYTAEGEFSTEANYVFKADLVITADPALLPNGYQVTVTFKDRKVNSVPIVFTTLLPKP